MMVEQMHVHHSSTVDFLKEGITNKKLNYFGLAIASHVSAYVHGCSVHCGPCHWL